MPTFYGEDLAYIQAAGFGAMAEGVAAEIIAILRERGIWNATIGDVGCGAGVAARHLLEAGFQVWALDQSAPLLEIARAVAPRAMFLPCASVYDVALPRADAIVAIGEVLNYHSPDGDPEGRVRTFFANAAASLRPGGVLAFDVIVRGTPAFDARTWAAGADWAILAETVEHRGTGWLKREMETFVRKGGAYRRARETHHVRVLDTSELGAALLGAGFRVRTFPAYGRHRLLPRREAFLCERV